MIWSSQVLSRREPPKTSASELVFDCAVRVVGNSERSPQRSPYLYDLGLVFTPGQMNSLETPLLARSAMRKPCTWS